MEDFEYNKKTADKIWEKQERYLRLSFVRSWFRQYLDELREMSDDELLEELDFAWSNSYSHYCEAFGVFLFNIDMRFFIISEAEKRTFISKKFYWRYLVTEVKITRECSDQDPELWRKHIMNKYSIGAHLALP